MKLVSCIFEITFPHFGVDKGNFIWHSTLRKNDFHFLHENEAKRTKILNQFLAITCNLYTAHNDLYVQKVSFRDRILPSDRKKRFLASQNVFRHMKTFLSVTNAYGSVENEFRPLAGVGCSLAKWFCTP